MCTPNTNKRRQRTPPILAFLLFIITGHSWRLI
jgi:hypothetical protein